MDPTSLLALLAIGGGSLLLFNLVDDDDGGDDAEPEPQPEATNGDDLIVDHDWGKYQDGVLRTLDGDDTVRSGEIDPQTAGSDSPVARIELGRGDDVLEAGVVRHAEIFGGLGDDSITLGDADDVVINTGGGNDTVTIGGSAISAHVDLGSGDDRIVIDGALNIDGDQQITGGAGKDIFEYRLAHHGGSDDADGHTYPVTDFVSGEDRLVIDPDTENSGMSYVSHRINDDGWVEITLTDPDDPSQTVLTTIAVNRGVTLDDIDIVGAEPQPPEADPGATEGDDTITSYDQEADRDSVLSALGGDDLVQLDIIPDQVDLGSGNDTFEGGVADPDTTWGQVTVAGGSGDDVLKFGQGTNVFASGGDGDDVFVVSDGSFGGGDLGLALFGDDGDDVFHIEGATPREGEEHSTAPVFVSGGDGADVFEVSLLPDDLADDPSPRALGIADFVSGEDKLVVDPTSMAGDATYTGYTLQSDGGSGHYEVVFHYTHPDHPDGLNLTIYTEEGRFAASDIEIVQSLPPRDVTATA